MKKLIALVLVLVCVFGLVGCQSKPNTPADIEIDTVRISRSSDGGATTETVEITDKEIISELLTMHNGMRTKATNQPVADERTWVIFQKDNTSVIEWCISVPGKDWTTSIFITCSNMLDIGNHSIESEFDYNRIIEIFNEFED